MVEIKIKIFDDGVDPITCIRDIKKQDMICPMLMTTRMGTAFTCRLFADNFGSNHQEILSYYTKGECLLWDWCYAREGYIRPHEKCIKARIKQIKLTRCEYTQLTQLYNNGDACSIAEDEFRGAEIQTLRRLCKKGIVKINSNYYYQVTFIGREYIEYYKRKNHENIKI